MFAQSIVLRSSSGSLTITPDEGGVGGWSQVHLVVEGSTRPLGAEALRYIAKQLTSFLTDPAPDRRWILSLAELHTSAHGEHAPGATIVELRDANAKWLAELVPTPTEKADWLRQLSSHSVP